MPDWKQKFRELSQIEEPTLIETMTIRIPLTVYAINFGMWDTAVPRGFEDMWRSPPFRWERCRWRGWWIPVIKESRDNV